MHDPLDMAFEESMHKGAVPQPRPAAGKTGPGGQGQVQKGQSGKRGNNGGSSEGSTPVPNPKPKPNKGAPVPNPKPKPNKGAAGKDKVNSAEWKGKGHDGTRNSRDGQGWDEKVAVTKPAVGWD